MKHLSVRHILLVTLITASSNSIANQETDAKTNYYNQEIIKDLDGDGIDDKVILIRKYGNPTDRDENGWHNFSLIHAVLKYQLSTQDFNDSIIFKNNEILNDELFSIGETDFGFKFGHVEELLRYTAEYSTFVIYDKEAREMRISGCLTAGKWSNSFLNIISGKFKLQDEDSPEYTVNKEGKIQPLKPIYLKNYHGECGEELAKLLKKYRVKAEE